MSGMKHVQFAIEAFEIRSFSSSVSPNYVRKDRLDYRIQHLFDVDHEKLEFSVGFKVKVVAGKKRGDELANIETLTKFKLKGVENEEMARLPEHLIITFLSISYSNTRGALAAKAQGTIAGEVPLPLINPTEIVRSIANQVEESKVEVQ